MQPYSIYVHIPFCKARCSYCAFSSNTDMSLQKAYFDKLTEEIQNAYLPQRQIATVFFGGGTPSSVDEKYISYLFEFLRKKFTFSPDCEITCEVNPESATYDKMRLLRELGVNRVSFGLQSLNDGTLKKIGRLHNSEQFLQAVDTAFKVGIDNVNADVIVGLPESEKEFLSTIQGVCALPLSHLSVYALELYSDTPLWQLRDQCPTDQDYLADLYDKAVSMLDAHGFKRYETSNFAKEGRQCKHNLNYWKEGRYYGFGAAASGFVEDTRYTNLFDIRDYIAADNVRQSQQTESLDEQANEYVMLALRLAEGVDEAEFTQRYKKDFWQYFTNADKLLKQGFLKRVDGRIVIPDDKVYVANSVLCELVSFDE